MSKNLIVIVQVMKKIALESAEVKVNKISAVYVMVLVSALVNVVVMVKSSIAPENVVELQ